LHRTSPQKSATFLTFRKSRFGDFETFWGTVKNAKKVTFWDASKTAKTLKMPKNRINWISNLLTYPPGPEV
jgi:hypothetical protein